MAPAYIPTITSGGVNYASRPVIQLYPPAPSRPVIKTLPTPAGRAIIARPPVHSQSDMESVIDSLIEPAVEADTPAPTLSKVDTATNTSTAAISAASSALFMPLAAQMAMQGAPTRTLVQRDEDNSNASGYVPDPLVDKFGMACLIIICCLLGVTSCIIVLSELGAFDMVDRLEQRGKISRGLSKFIKVMGFIFSPVFILPYLAYYLSKAGRRRWQAFRQRRQRREQGEPTKQDTSEQYLDNLVEMIVRDMQQFRQWTLYMDPYRGPVLRGDQLWPKVGVVEQEVPQDVIQDLQRLQEEANKISDLTDSSNDFVDRTHGLRHTTPVSQEQNRSR